LEISKSENIKLSKEIHYLTLTNQKLATDVNKRYENKSTAIRDTSALLDVKIKSRKDPVLTEALEILLQNMKYNVDHIDAIKER